MSVLAPNAWPRWEIRGRYTVETPLHIGDGEFREHWLTASDQQGEDAALPASVARDGAGQLYLPSSSLRGAVRAALMRYFACEPEFDGRHAGDGHLWFTKGKSELIRLIYGLFGFGREEASDAVRFGWTMPEVDRPYARHVPLKDGLGGKVSFFDSYIIDDCVARNAVASYLKNAVLKDYDKKKEEEFGGKFLSKSTLVETSVEIEPATRAVEHGQLANREMVPPGTAFDVSVTGVGLCEEEIALLLLGLELAGEQGFGGGRKMGAGRLSWQYAGQGAVRWLDKPDLKAWIEKAKMRCGPVLNRELAHIDGRARVTVVEMSKALRALGDCGWTEITVALIFDGPFLVRDPRRTASQQKVGEEGLATLPRLGPDAKPILPGRSIKGALRARARRIERTLFGDPEQRYDQTADRQNQQQQKKKRTLTDWLFGDTEWGALVEFDDFNQTDQARPQPPDPVQHFVAIDRFTGGQAPERLYSFKPAWQPVLSGDLRLDHRRINRLLSDEKRSPEDKDGVRAALWLLLLALRDLRDGEISFGLGAAKGYGTCTARFGPDIGALFAFRTASELDQCRDTFLALVKRNNQGELPEGPPSPITANVSTHAITASSLGAAGSGSTPSPPASVNLTEFINPYNFVPVIRSDDKAKANRWFPNKGESGFQKIKGEQLGRLRHDRWLSKEIVTDEHGNKVERPLYSGRILCRLTTENPTFIGAGRDEQQPGKPRRVHPFELKVSVPAIPASSLRGLFSSIAEAASQSALRILTDRVLSFRMAANPRELPRLVGIVQQAPIGDLQLQPLCEIRRRPPQFRKELIAQTGERPLPIPLPVRARYDNLIKERVDSDAGGLEYYRTKLAKNAAAYDPDARYAEQARKNDGAKLAPGDVVFYKTASEDGRTAVSYIAPSQIWRQQAGSTAGGAHVFDYFREIDAELLPFDAWERKWLSPAELIFGFVSDQAKDREKRKAEARRPAFAGRVRFSFGRMTTEEPGGHYGEPRVLKILSSPKPPCPPFYFRHKGEKYGRGGYIAKSALNPGVHIPNGRKFYHDHGQLIDQPGALVGASRRPDEDPSQKVCITPINSGATLFFHVDFDNLNGWELGLLCYALQPNPGYRHRIGMGKRLGLGRVKIEPLALFGTDRIGRYLVENPLQRPRHADYRTCRFVDPAALGPPGRYEAEWAALNDHSAETASFQSLTDKVRNRTSVDRVTLTAIERFGEAPPSGIPVRQPQLADRDEEQETFRWYQSNERRSQEWLPPLLEDGPTLRELPQCKLSAFPRRQ